MKLFLLEIGYMEVILIILPSLVIFLTIFVLMRMWFKNQLKMKMLDVRDENTQFTRPLKLQAYERLMLFCERVSLQNLLLRIQSKDMSAQDLKAALILSIQQEFEYNLSQQLYVSEKLWQIIKLAKNQMIEIITHVGSKVSPNGSGDDFSKQLILFTESQKQDPIETAKLAIKKEVTLLL
jgi:hypothetical protein